MTNIGTANSVTKKVDKEITTDHDINSWCVCNHPKISSNVTIGQPFNPEIISVAFHLDIKASPWDKQQESIPHTAGGYHHEGASRKGQKWELKYVMFI